MNSEAKQVHENKTRPRPPWCPTDSPLMWEWMRDTHFLPACTADSGFIAFPDEYNGDKRSRETAM